MEHELFDNVKFEKQKANARFDRFRKISKLWQILELVLILALISWSSLRVPAVLRTSAACFVEFSAYLLNHHVVFLIGNAIIVLLFMLCRRNEDLNLSGSGEDIYEDYGKHRENIPAAPEVDLLVEVGGGDDEENKQIVIVETPPVIEDAIRRDDDVAVAIEEATRQIKRFQRTQSEKLRREIAVRPRPEFRRSETENGREVGEAEAREIESLSNEEFRRTVDAFIDEHWSKKKGSRVVTGNGVITVR